MRKLYLHLHLHNNNSKSIVYPGNKIHLVLGVLVELRQDAWVGLQLLPHGGVAKLAEGSHRMVAQAAQGAAKVVATAYG